MNIIRSAKKFKNHARFMPDTVKLVMLMGVIFNVFLKMS